MIARSGRQTHTDYKTQKCNCTLERTETFTCQDFSRQICKERVACKRIKRQIKEDEDQTASLTEIWRLAYSVNLSKLSNKESPKAGTDKTIDARTTIQF